MLPVSSDAVLRIPDPDGDPVTWTLRYLLDEHQIAYLELHREFEQLCAANISTAAREVDAGLRGKRRRKGDAAPAKMEERVAEAARQILRRRMAAEPRVFVAFIDHWIDLFVTGWESKDARVAALRPGEKPSSRLLFSHKLRLFNIIQERQGELTGVTGPAARKS